MRTGWRAAGKGLAPRRRNRRLVYRRFVLACLPYVCLLLIVSAAGAVGEKGALPLDRPPEGAFVAVRDVAPGVIEEIRYKGRHNFVGRPIRGYREPLCILTRQAARSVARVQRQLRRRGLGLKIYDCYRPQRAVDHFVEWAEDLDDDLMRAEFYPRVPKTRLFADGYIAAKSGHSRGSTVDLTIVRRPPGPQARFRPGQRLAPCFAARDHRFRDNSVEMGTGYDCFDRRSHTLSPAIKGIAKRNRLLLKRLMNRAGFKNLAEEWWHYTLRAEPFPNTYFDFPVARRSLR